MNSNQAKEIIELYANDPYITCDDVTKCGSCWREKIKSEVAKEILAGNEEIDINSWKFCEDETRRRWRETDLYKRVMHLFNQGITLEKIGKDLLKEGIEI